MPKKQFGERSGGVNIFGKNKVAIEGDAVEGDKVVKNQPGRSGGVDLSAGAGAMITGDIVGRDKITTTTTTTTSGINPAQLVELMKLFAEVNRKIDAQAVKPDVKEELKENVKKIEEEVRKGENADPDKVGRWLKFLAAMSEDIFQVTVATLVNPVAGVGTAVRLIAQKAKEGK